MIIDGDKSVDESNETNNTFSIPIKLQQNVFGDLPDHPFYLAKSLSNKEINKSEPYDLLIHDIYGKFIKKVQINSASDEKETIKNLPNGLYFLNSANGSRKISVNNN